MVPGHVTRASYSASLLTPIKQIIGGNEVTNVLRAIKYEIGVIEMKPTFRSNVRTERKRCVRTM